MRPSQDPPEQPDLAERALECSHCGVKVCDMTNSQVLVFIGTLDSYIEELATKRCKDEI